jgi:hypothetical protein
MSVTIAAAHPLPVCLPSLPATACCAASLWCASNRLKIEEPTWEEAYRDNIEEAKPFDEFFCKPADDDDEPMYSSMMNGVRITQQREHILCLVAMFVWMPCTMAAMAYVAVASTAGPTSPSAAAPALTQRSAICMRACRIVPPSAGAAAAE